MTEELVRVRFVHDHSLFDIGPGRPQMWRAWSKGTIVEDRADIELLLSQGAPVEKIEAKLSASPQPKF
jgi:hypothetical protein